MQPLAFRNHRITRIIRGARHDYRLFRRGAIPRPGPRLIRNHSRPPGLRRNSPWSLAPSLNLPYTRSSSSDGKAVSPIFPHRSNPGLLSIISTHSLPDPIGSTGKVFEMIGEPASVLASLTILFFLSAIMIGHCYADLPTQGMPIRQSLTSVERISLKQISVTQVSVGPAPSSVDLLRDRQEVPSS